MTAATILRPGQPGRPSVGTGWPLLRLGFRPFYLLAAAFAAAAVPLWLASYLGLAPALPRVSLGWHLHEMVFGFGSAVIVGFLFTAARNWTGLWTPRGGALAAFALLWLAGRVAMLLCPPLPAALIDLPFIPAAAFALARLLLLAGNRRNLPLVGLLGLIAAANAAYHAGVLGWLPLQPEHAAEAALLLIVLLATVLGGRVIPGFTANATGAPTVSNEKLNRSGIALVAAACAAAVLGLPGVLTAVLCAAAAAVHFRRMAGWAPLRTAAHPLLWILHLAYGWIGVGLLLLGGAAVGVGSDSSAMHALAIGAMSSLMLGMLTRTALGHTGRPLVTRKREAVTFMSVQAGVIARLCANIFPDFHRNTILLISAACWTTAFLLYLIIYVPYLCRARRDGREG